MTRSRFAYPVLTGVAALLALSGCSGVPSSGSTDSNPTGGTQPAVSPTSPSGLPPDSPGPMAEGEYIYAGWEELSVADLKDRYPEEVFANNEDGAFLTAMIFLKQVSEVFVTGDASVLRSISGPECGWCADHVALVLEAAQSNVRITGYEYLLADEFFGGSIEGGNVVAELPVTRTEIVQWRRDGTEIVRAPEIEETVRMELAYRDGQWFVEGVEEV